MGRSIQIAQVLGLTVIVSTCWASTAKAHSSDGWLPLNFVGYKSPFGFDSDNTYTEVWGDGDYAYLGSTELGIAIIDISNPAAPQHVLTYGAPNKMGSGDIQIQDDVGYFASNQGSGVEIVDLQNPLSPKLISNIDTNSKGFAEVSEIAVNDQFLFQVSESSSIVKAFDISNLTNPLLVREFETNDSSGLADLHVSNDHLYIAGLGGTEGEGASYVFDIQNIGESNPTLLAQIPTGKETASMWPIQDESKLIVTHRKLGGNIHVWNTETLDSASLLTTANASDFDINSYSTGEVAVLDNVAYVAWYEAGIQVIDLDNLNIDGSLQRIGVFGTSPDSSPLDGLVGNRSVYPFLGHDRVLLSDTTWGLYIVDATNVLPVVGDFDGNREIQAADLDLLSVNVRDGTHNAQFDLTSDGFVDEDDRRFWVFNIANSTFGDSNLDGAFDSTDLVLVFISGEYEDEVDSNSLWETGDWNGDGDFNTSDLIAAFQAGDYEIGNALSVPEYHNSMVGLSWIVMFIRYYGKKKQNLNKDS